MKIFHTVAVAGLKRCINKNPEKSWVVAQDIIGAAAYNDAALGVGKLADDPALRLENFILYGGGSPAKRKFHAEERSFRTSEE